MGDVSVDRYDHREGNDDFSQAGDLYRLMKPEQKEELAKNIAGSLGQFQKRFKRVNCANSSALFGIMGAE